MAGARGGTLYVRLPPQRHHSADFLKSVDQSLVNIRDAIRVGTQENSTLIQLMKDFDNALIHSTVVVNTDNIPVRFDGGLFDAENPTNQTRYADFRYDYR